MKWIWYGCKEISMLAASWCACHKREKGFRWMTTVWKPPLGYAQYFRDTQWACSMYGILFTYIYHINQQNLGKYSIHGEYGVQELHQPRRQDFADGIFLMQSMKLADEMVAASVNHPQPGTLKGFQVVGGSHMAVGIEDMMWLVRHPGLIHVFCDCSQAWWGANFPSCDFSTREAARVHIRWETMLFRLLIWW